MTPVLAIVTSGTSSPCTAIDVAIQNGRDLDEAQLAHVDVCAGCRLTLAERFLAVGLAACGADDVATKAAAGVPFWDESPVRAWRFVTGQWRTGSDSPGDPWPLNTASAQGNFIRRGGKLLREEIKQGATTTTTVANFVALILSEVVRRDEQTTSRELIIGAIVRGRPVVGRIRAEDLNHPSKWVPARFGSAAYIYPGRHPAFIGVNAGVVLALVPRRPHPYRLRRSQRRARVPARWWHDQQHQ